MNLGLIRSEFRRLTGDRSQPFLYIKADVDQWINEACNEAATRARLLHDKTTPAVVEVPLLVDQRTYLLHPSVLDIESVVLQQPSLTTDPGRRCALELADADDIQWEIDHRPNRTGWARHYYFYGEDGGPANARHGPRLVLDSKPGELDGMLYLSVFRLPLAPLVLDEDEPEFHPRHHDGLIHWALHRAYSTSDAEGSNAARAAYHLGQFETRYGYRPDANVQRKQKRHRATVVRPIRFG